MNKTIPANTMRRMTMEIADRMADKDIEERKKVISDINSQIYVAAMDGKFKFRKCGYTCYRHLNRTVTIMW